MGNVVYHMLERDRTVFNCRGTQNCSGLSTDELVRGITVEERQLVTWYVEEGW